MLMSRRDLLAAGALAPLLTGCAADLARFSDDTLPALADRLGVCAASFVTLEAGQPSAPVAVSGCEPPCPVRSDTVFQAASLTKPVIAFVALQLVREGLLDVHAPVSRYLPGGYAHRQNPFGGAKAKRFDLVPAHTLARIPVATLLNHSAGLPNWTSGVLQPEFEPGTRWQYSGEGYALLQAVIEAVTGQGIEPAVARYAFEPLGMRHARLRLTDDIRAQVVGSASCGVDGSPGRASQLDFFEPNAAASLHTTAADYAKLLSAWLADAELLRLTLAHTVATDAKLGLAWGLGWGIETAAGGPYLWQWGNNPGFRAFAMASVSSGNGFVLFTNSERGLALAAPLARATVPAVHGVFRFHMLG